MATTPSSSSTGSEFEFSSSHNELIGDLARKMSLVGLVTIVFGVLQMINGIVAFIAGRNPDELVAAAREAGIAEEQLQQLQTALAGGDWLSPFVISTISFIIVGLILLLVGIWTRKASGGFAGIVRTQGRDISRLMDALDALRKQYSLIYYIIMLAVIVFLVGFGINLWKMSQGG
jgi:hypothetical protein